MSFFWYSSFASILRDCLIIVINIGAIFPEVICIFLMAVECKKLARASVRAFKEAKLH